MHPQILSHIIAAWVLSSFGLQTGQCWAVPVDAVRFVVADQVVLSSDILIFRRVSEQDHAHWFWTTSTPTKRVVDKALIITAASDLPLYQPNSDLINTRLYTFQQSFPSPEAFNSFLESVPLTEDELKATLRSRLVVELFLRRNLPTSANEDATLLSELLGQLRQRSSVREIKVEMP